MPKNLTIKNIFKKTEIDHISNISSARFSARQSSSKSLDTLPPGLSCRKSSARQGATQIDL